MFWKKIKKYWKAVWRFIWEDDSVLSLVVNAILAFLIIKFLLYPGLGLAFSTDHPVVAVMSSSMEHSGQFENWWNNDQAFCNGIPCNQQEFYSGLNITKSEFQNFRFMSGFNTGDIIIIFGAKPENIKIGDVIVYWSSEPVPIIHRVVTIYNESGQFYFRTKGDNNPGFNYNEVKIPAKEVLGKAVLRIPYLGWVKIGFVNLLQKTQSLFSA